MVRCASGRRRCDEGERVEQPVDALDRREATEPHEVPGIGCHAERLSRGSAVEAVETIEIEPERDHADPAGRGDPVFEQLIALGAAQGHDAVRPVAEEPFCTDECAGRA